MKTAFVFTMMSFDGDAFFLLITCDEVGTRVVTRAKYCISFLRPFQGMVPWKPMPMLRVAATMRVSSGVAMVDEWQGDIQDETVK